MATHRAPKQWQLTKDETITSFENWRQNLVYVLSLDPNFAPFLNTTWLKKTSTTPLRGLVDDTDAVAEADRKTAAQKNAQLELMLGQIANYCSIISRNSIIKSSTSLQDIWQRIRQHFGFQSTGAHFLDLANISLEPNEKPEDLYQRLLAFFEDNLLTTGGGIQHHGADLRTDEDMTPTLENTVVVLWLKLINPALPALVKQRYGAELRNQSIASLKPEISMALSSLLDELRAMEDTKVLRTMGSMGRPFKPKGQKQPYKSCILCKTAGRSSYTSHNLIDCRMLPESDRRRMGRTRMVDGLEDQFSDIDEDNANTPHEEDDPNPTFMACRVNVIQSPFLNTYYGRHPVRVTLDTGATTNLMQSSFAKHIGLPIKPASQSARQADGVTPLEVVGEVHCQLTRDDLQFQLDALVVEKLDVDILAGNPFLVTNDIGTRPAKRQVVVGGSRIIYYGNQGSHNASIRRAQSFLLRAPDHQSVILPGDYVQLSIPSDLEPDSVWAVEPRFDSPSNRLLKQEWAWPQPQEIQSVGHSIRVPNASDVPIVLKRNEHLCQIRAIDSVVSPKADLPPTFKTPPKTICKPYSSQIKLDPDNILSPNMQDQFKALHLKYDETFNPQISKYNGASGKIQGVVNMGPTLPPQRKGRLPHYNRDQLGQLQEKFDELEAAGVFAKPEQVGVTVEYLNLSFLVQKPNGGNRLVTSFGEVGQYSKPQPSLMPNVDGVLREIARWKFIIISDLLKSFYQIPLSKGSMKYCGVCTPYKGIRVYTRSAMGMPGSETCLEEVMSRVLGHLIQEGCVAKIADDLYCGGDSPEEALSNWARVLDALSKNNLRLSASKTVICPLSATILGWLWSNGTLKARPHSTSALAMCPPPTTVQGLRSFIGAYKVLSRVLRGYAELLDPLEQVTSNKPSREKVVWSDDLLTAFKKAQSALSSTKVITIPRPDDILWIVTDGSVKNRGIGATLFILRKGQLYLAGFFNAKLRQHQVTWLPCEVEALCIAASIKHFSPYIIQSKHIPQILTDSKPCVQAYERLCRGEFSASSRVTTFLSAVSRHQANVRHIAGEANLPADYTSRNPSMCSDKSCQVCKFISDTEDSVVRGLSVKDVTDGATRMPFTSRAAWSATQHECPDLRRTHSHMVQGTRPSKKATKIPDVKRYLKVAVKAHDNLLVVRDILPLQPPRERIIVPRHSVEGLVMAIHLKFEHPSVHQMKQLFTRYFYALDLDKILAAAVAACHVCNSLKSFPVHMQTQSSTEPPDRIGISFAADVLRRYRQYILVLRETVSSLTLGMLIDSEQHTHLRDAILVLTSGIRAPGAGGIRIRVDASPGLVALVNDPALLQNGITLEVGRIKNINKNPVAERAIQELGLECLHLSPEGGPLSAVLLAKAFGLMNSRIRHGGLSALEIWTQRDQITGEQLPLDDRDLIIQQNKARMENHGPSAKSKGRNKSLAHTPKLQVGDLVFLASERDKTKARDKYLVTQISGDFCQVRKFTQSQFRSKVYDIKLTDCYQVMPNTLNHKRQGPIRGLEHPSESDHEQDCEPVSECANEPIRTHPLYPVATLPAPSSAMPAVPNPSRVPDTLTPHPLPDFAVVPSHDPAVPDAIAQPPSHHPAVPDAIAQPPSHHPAVPDAIAQPPVTTSDSAHDVTPRRSTREHRPPSWQTSDNWVME